MMSRAVRGHGLHLIGPASKPWVCWPSLDFIDIVNKGTVAAGDLNTVRVMPKTDWMPV